MFVHLFIFLFVHSFIYSFILFFIYLGPMHKFIFLFNYVWSSDFILTIYFRSFGLGFSNGDPRSKYAAFQLANQYSPWSTLKFTKTQKMMYV